MRIDTASRHVSAPPDAVYRAFAEAGAMERWLPPRNMHGHMIRFDFRDGGSYRMHLTFMDPQQGTGKTSADSDEVEVRLIRIEAGKRIEQEVTFESDDPAFAGTMRMVWTFRPKNGDTVVTVRAEDVPPGIDPQDHQTGLDSSLENLAAYVEASAR